MYGGREVWPLVEGGKGVAATNHASSGAWAAAGGIGTVSAVNADSYDEKGEMISFLLQVTKLFFESDFSFIRNLLLTRFFTFLFLRSRLLSLREVLLCVTPDLDA